MHSHFTFQFPDIDAKATITLQKTIQVPNDGKAHPLPPGTGEFPFYLHGEQHIVPMNHENEALWLRFSDHNPDAPMAIKVLAGGINTLNGEKETDETYATLRNNDENGKGQNYLVLPQQPWLDGFMSLDNTVRQFIAVGLGQGKSVEEKLESTQRGGLQFIVIPTKKEIVEKNKAERLQREEEARKREEEERKKYEEAYAAALKIREERVKEAQERKTELETKLAAMQASASADSVSIAAIELEIQKLNLVIKSKGRVAYGELAQRSAKEVTDMSHEGIECLDDLEDKCAYLESGSVDFHKRSKTSSTSLLSSLLNSLPSLPTLKMGLGGGGKIKQEIIASPYPNPADQFDVAQAKYMELDLINLRQFAILNGLPTPPRQPTAEEYTNAGGLWFDYLTHERAVIADRQSRLVGLEEANNLSALPVQAPVATLPRRVATIFAAGYFSAVNRVRAALERSNAQAPAQTNNSTPAP